MQVTTRNVGRDVERERLEKLGRKVRRRLDTNKAVQRLKVEGAEMWVVGNFLDAVECGRLITMIDEVARPSTTFDFDYSEGFRTSYSGDINPLDPFISKVNSRIDDLLGIDPTFGEVIQGQRYTAGQEFRTHTDWFPKTSMALQTEQKHGGQRAFTAMAYLNTVEQGGETDFPLLDIAVKPRQGVLLIWNNMDENGVGNTRTAHAGNPVPAGVKYIFTKWYRAQPWV